MPYGSLTLPRSSLPSKSSKNFFRSFGLRFPLHLTSLFPKMAMASSVAAVMASATGSSSTTAASNTQQGDFFAIYDADLNDKASQIGKSVEASSVDRSKCGTS